MFWFVAVIDRLLSCTQRQEIAFYAQVEFIVILPQVIRDAEERHSTEYYQCWVRNSGFLYARVKWGKSYSLCFCLLNETSKQRHGRPVECTSTGAENMISWMRSSSRFWRLSNNWCDCSSSVKLSVSCLVVKPRLKRVQARRDLQAALSIKKKE